MNIRSCAILVVSLLAFATLGAAEKQKQTAASLNDYPLWASKKRGFVGQLVPGLNAVLQLTDAQRQQLIAAREEMANDEGLKAARSISKNDPNVTPEQKEKARAAVDAAASRLQEKIAGILTPEQKALIEKINAAYAAAMEDIGIVYAEKFASVKADEAARRRIQQEKNHDTEENFLHKLDAILTPAQKEAMDRAAQEEEQKAAEAAPAKKSAKQ